MKLMALDKQMVLFQEGGMIDEGGTTDPISGNDVPVGSLQEEVRDDIPAQLSEGEFVMPADVVRYHGLDKMMALRDEAKMGLQRMEAMGQMGNAEEATIPSGVPFGLEDLDIAEEPREMQVGGFISSAPQFTPGGVQQSQFQNYTPQYTPYQPPQILPMPDYSAYQAPQQAFTPTAPTQVPPFTQFVRPKTATYVDSKGNEIQIPVGDDGIPLIPVPPGYTLKTDTPVTTDPTPDPTQQQQPVTTQQGRDDPSDEPPSQPRLDQFGREKDPRISQVTSTKEFSDLAKKVDPRGFLEKITDSFTGAIGASTTSREYQKALDELSVGVANYTDDPEEQKALLADITSKIGAISRTAAGEALAPVISGDVYDAEQKRKASILTDEDRRQQGQTSVATTQVTGDAAGKTVRQTAEEFRADEARRAGLVGADKSQTTDFADNLIAQTANALMARGVSDIDALRAAQTAVNTGKIDPDVAAQFKGAEAALTDASLASSSLAGADKAVPTGVSAAIRRSQQTKQPEPKPDLMADDPAGVAESGPVKTTRRPDMIDTQPSARTLNKEEVDRQTQNYRNKGYSTSKAKKAARNKVAADNAAKQQRRDRGETEANIAKTSAVTDSSGKAVTSGSDGSIVTSGPQTEDPGPSKIVCTEMYRQTQLDDWKQAIKIWGVYEKKYLTPYHEKGYHWLFMPWVNGMRRSTTLTSIGAYLAMARTQHLKHVMTKGKAPDNTIGNLWCKIIHPIVYVAGRTKEWLKL